MLDPHGVVGDTTRLDRDETCLLVDPARVAPCLGDQIVSD